MRTSTHQIAVFEEGFTLVGVDWRDVKERGAEKVWRAIQQHEWVQQQQTRVVIVYQTDDGRMRAYGDRDLVKAVTTMNFREINFGHELTLEWSPGSDNDDGASDDEL
ncbi:MAG: hypothetical protein E6J26_04845 [Chloroflexi bacterium]|nr:MAG: hypothetical protein E6J26_04845 [Chloroflexota bacterium]